MTTEQEKRLAQLKQAYELGLLDEETYQTAKAAFIKTDSGAVAQGDKAVAIGRQGINVSGSVSGDIITGNFYLGKPTNDPQEAIRIYCQTIVQSSGSLPLRGIDIGSSDPTTLQTSMGLAQVYIALDTKSPVNVPDVEGRQQELPEKRETKPLSALAAAVADRQLVILGDPGSGKTTFVRHLAYCLAANTLYPDDNWLTNLPYWPLTESDTIPVFIVLRDFARSLPRKLPLKADPSHLWDFIKTRLAAQNLDFVVPVLQKFLQAGKVLLLLDGLDEATTYSKRAFVRDAIIAFVQRYSGNRVLITCRVLSYQDVSLRLPPSMFSNHDLALFDEVKIDNFITAWYRELARLGTIPHQDADVLIRKFQKSVRRSDLWRLASNPLLLTVMALIHTHKGRLPDARALLYEEAIDILLWRWDQIKAGGEDGVFQLRQLLQRVGRSDMDLKKVLWQLAFETYNQVDSDQDVEKLTDIDESDLIKVLATLTNEDWAWASQVVTTMKQRAGLLLEREPGLFTFSHRTFQEYLAGAYLSIQPRFALEGTKLAVQGALWREVILLAVGRLVYRDGETDKPLALVAELCPAAIKDDTDSWYKAWLAGDALLEIGLKRVQDSSLGKKLLARVQKRLAALLSDGKLTSHQRTEAGNTLDKLGDPRRGVGVRVMDERVLPDLELCYVPAGSFWMGSSDDDSMAAEVEKPMHQLDASYDYWIGLYPVTVAQFQAFLKQTDYHMSPMEDSTNRPVHGISWKDALAFCRWLNGVAHKYNFLPNNYFISLPSEAEWEKASRGGMTIPKHPILVNLTEITKGTENVELIQNPDPKRIYPWGSLFNKESANYLDIGVMTTTAVGAFPSGKSPYGLLDMSGNVFEWTRSRWGGHFNQPGFVYPYRFDDLEVDDLEANDLRILRGGDWNSPYSKIRCSYRERDFPDHKFHGLRIAVVPFRQTLEIARWFLEQAGFEINQKHLNGLLCSSIEQFWSDISPFYVHAVLDHALDMGVFQEILATINIVYRDFYDGDVNLENQLVVVVIDRPPQIGDLHQMYAIQAHHGLTIIPLPQSLMMQARIDRREKEALREQIDRYIGKTDLYYVTGAVSDVLSFFGREGDLKEIHRNLIGGHSMILSGIRKIGKSSFLARLREQSSWPVSYIDLEGYFSALDFAYEEIIENWHTTINALYPQLTLPDWKGIPESANFPRKAQLFRKAVDALLTVLLQLPNKPGLLLFLDETEYLFTDESNYLSFASSLRGIAQKSRWKGRFAILGTGLNLDVNRIDHIFDNRNPFYSFFVEKPLGCLDFSATYRMMATIGSQMGIHYSDEAVHLLVEASGGHPALTRQLCSLAIRDKDRPLTIDAQQAKLAITSYLSQPHNYFARSLWAIDNGGPDMPEAEILKLLSIHSACNETLLFPQRLSNDELEERQIALAKLQDQSLVKKADDGQEWQLTIPLYRRWIRRTILNLPEQSEGIE